MSEKVIADFWSAMATNDFAHASQWLHPDFEYYMPQTGEYLKGRSAFAALNNAYPAEGIWRFEVRSIIADAERAVSDVAITDGVMTATAITFHVLKNDLILKQREYWPDSYPAPEWRADLVFIVDVPPF